MDVWADDGGSMAFVLSVLEAAGKIPVGAITTHKVLFTAGIKLVHRLTFDEMAAVIAGMDALTPAEMEALEPRRGSIVGGDVDRVTGLALWGMLCMHAGARMPQDARMAAQHMFAPPPVGFWALDPARRKLAKAYFDAVVHYGPTHGAVLFPCEMPWEFDSDSWSRYIDRQASMATQTERTHPVDSWHVRVFHQCAGCRAFETEDGAAFGCCGGQCARYCSLACQKTHRPIHKAACTAPARKK
jgi:hypothetical protein